MNKFLFIEGIPRGNKFLYMAASKLVKSFQSKKNGHLTSEARERDLLAVVRETPCAEVMRRVELLKAQNNWDVYQLIYRSLGEAEVQENTSRKFVIFVGIVFFIEFLILLFLIFYF